MTTIADIVRQCDHFIALLKAEPVPAPGNPPEYPFYLKPIPVNERDVQQTLNELLLRREPKLIKWLYSTWNADSESIKDQELRNAIRDGDFDESWLVRWNQRYAEFINERMVPEWRAASAVSAEMWGRGLALMDIEHGFDLLDARMDQWVAMHSGELAVQLSQAQYEALRNIVRYHTVQKPIASSELQKLLRPLIGLTPAQADAVRRYREALVEEGLAQRVIDHRVGNYSSRLRRFRARRIARTEIAFAYNQGGYLAMQDAIEAGAFEGPLLKEWSTSEDERVCPICGPLNGVKVAFEGEFEKGGSVPPAHPNCRCVLLYAEQGDLK